MFEHTVVCDSLVSTYKINLLLILQRAYQHVMSHHIFTNVEGFDSDIDTSDMEFYRIKESQKYSTIYRFQSIYSPVLYFFLGISIRIGDMCNYYRGVSVDSQFGKFCLPGLLILQLNSAEVHSKSILLLPLRI